MYPTNPFSEFITAHTTLMSMPLVPEISLYLATEYVPIWEAAELFLQQKNIDPPYWAFCWPGGQALSRYVLDHPVTVKNHRVLDFASGCGIGAIAAAMAGARESIANDIDSLSLEAIQMNAAANESRIEIISADLLDTDRISWDIILAGDICYQQTLALRVINWLRQQAGRGVTVLLGDPGRAYMPTERLFQKASYRVPTSLELESQTSRESGVWQVLP